MPRASRRDFPGSWHHVMNRGLARRTVFEGKADVRAFLCLVACAVRRGELKVHAFVILTTHCHLLVESPVGRLSEAMRRIFNGYVRYFNRTRRRDGPLFSGRFRSRPVESLTYRYKLVPYIDQNPMQARLADSPFSYPYGSASLWVSKRRPPWLAMSWIGKLLEGCEGDDARANTYRSYFGTLLTPSQAALVEARLEHGAKEPDGLDDLVGAAPEQVARWMERKARLADNTKPGIPLVSASAAEAVLSRELGSEGIARRHSGRGCASGPDEFPLLARVAVLRDLCGLSYSAIAAITNLTLPSAHRRYLRHAKAVQDDPAYADRVSNLLRRCLTEAHPPSDRRGIEKK